MCEKDNRRGPLVCEHAFPESEKLRRMQKSQKNCHSRKLLARILLDRRVGAEEGKYEKTTNLLAEGPTTGGNKPTRVKRKSTESITPRMHKAETGKPGVESELEP